MCALCTGCNVWQQCALHRTFCTRAHLELRNYAPYARSFMTRIAVWRAGLAGNVGEQSPREILNRASDDFRAGRIEQSAVVARSRRQVSLRRCALSMAAGHCAYYAGRLPTAATCLVSHRTVNPDDVENAAWHFLCVARAESARPPASRSYRSVQMPASRCARSTRCIPGCRLTPVQLLAAPVATGRRNSSRAVVLGPLSRGHRRCRARGRQIAIAASPRYAAVAATCTTSPGFI